MSCDELMGCVWNKEKPNQKGMARAQIALGLCYWKCYGPLWSSIWCWTSKVCYINSVHEMQSVPVWFVPSQMHLTPLERSTQFQMILTVLIQQVRNGQERSLKPHLWQSKETNNRNKPYYQTPLKASTLQIGINFSFCVGLFCPIQWKKDSAKLPDQLI